MKQHLNTLFVSTEKSYLRKEGEAVVISLEGKDKGRVPLHNLDGVVCFGNIRISPHLMAACATSGVTISFMNVYGKFQAAVVGFPKGNILLRKQQFRVSDNEQESLNFARRFIQGKVANSRPLLLRAARSGVGDLVGKKLRRTTTIMQSQLRAIDKSTDLGELRGIEGDCASRYFAHFDGMIRVEDGDMRFLKRSRRPPLDAPNAVLSFLYSMLVHDCRSALESSGLDAAAGFLHRDRPGRPSLALDLAEEFRSYLVDRLVLAMINRRQLRGKDFDFSDSGAVLLKDKARKRVLTAWQERKAEEVLHPFLQERMTNGMLVHIQARLLARSIRGDLDAYPPFLWK